MRKSFAILPALGLGLVLSVGCTPKEDNVDIDTSLDPVAVDTGMTMDDNTTSSAMMPGDNTTSSAMMPGDNMTTGADMPVVVESPE